jgi:N-acetylgalactosamine-N,N'-diacetylbacillosaminyl-diphospho-undecaprenol 4-alpha-N-acetylgalactosaminyltransferase
LDNRIELAGAKDNPFSFLAKAELFVLSSDFEGFGNVILEAMTCHCPVISTDCQSGPGEIITHNKDGLLVPVGDVDTMSNAIMSLLEDKSLRESLAMHAQTRVLDFRLESIVQQYYRAIV